MASPVLGITAINEQRRPAHHEVRVRSRPGHLLHLLLRGRYRLRCDRRRYELRAGDMLYYHDGEEVEWLGNEVPLHWIGVGFLAPELLPPADDQRHFRANPICRRCCHELVALAGVAGQRAAWLRHATVLQLLAALPVELRPDGVAGLWSTVEAALVRRGDWQARVADLARGHGCSVATLTRACRAETGTTPQRRLRGLRLAAALEALADADRVGTVAEAFGYPRIHEFSRDFAGYFGTPPSRYLGRRSPV